MRKQSFPITIDLPLLFYVDPARKSVHSHRYPLSLVPASVRRNTDRSYQAFATSSKYCLSKLCRLHPKSSKVDSVSSFDDNGDDVHIPDTDDDFSVSGSSFPDDGIEIEIEKIGNNCRRIRSKVVVEANLQILWNILTDYERLSDFIPGVAVSQLLDRRDNFARLFQIGQQNLALGLKFNARGVVDCYEKDLESLPFGQRRDIEFKMIEGDFQVFEGKWSIEQYTKGRHVQSDSFVSQEFRTILSYVVDVKPKLWLPVRLVEGRLCREIKMNLSCIREEAQKAFHKSF